ncbi:MAG: hypothetical protein MHPSP_002979, partial [Paramarteilia canceri]
VKIRDSSTSQELQPLLNSTNVLLYAQLILNGNSNNKLLSNFNSLCTTVSLLCLAKVYYDNFKMINHFKKNSNSNSERLKLLNDKLDRFLDAKNKPDCIAK